MKDESLCLQRQAKIFTYSSTESSEGIKISDSVRSHVCSLLTKTSSFKTAFEMEVCYFLNMKFSAYHRVSMQKLFAVQMN